MKGNIKKIKSTMFNIVASIPYADGEGFLVAIVHPPKGRPWDTIGLISVMNPEQHEADRRAAWDQYISACAAQFSLLGDKKGVVEKIVIFAELADKFLAQRDLRFPKPNSPPRE